MSVEVRPYLRLVHGQLVASLKRDKLVEVELCEGTFTHGIYDFVAPGTKGSCRTGLLRH